jgi:thiosulfate/3-mercaptopyruvate sulfurtransferase
MFDYISRQTLATLALVFSIPFAAAAQGTPRTLESHPNMIVSTDWLAGHLSDVGLVILHVGSQKDYDAGHIPGARLVTLADVSVTGETGLRLQMPSAAALQEALDRLGIADNARVVVYAGNESVQSATRVWFTLDYVGLGDRTSLLDGGLALWRTEGRPLATEAPRVAPSAFVPHPEPELIVDAQWVRAHLDDSAVQLLDARLAEFYSGANGGGMPRAGHIPGARNVPFPSVFEADGKLKTMDELRQLMEPSAPKLTVSYCHIGLQATVLYFVARYLGLEARLYDGSFQDWSRTPELPLEPAPPRKVEHE